MRIFKFPFLRIDKINKDTEISNKVLDQYVQIGKLVKQARIKKNISIEDLSRSTRIPEQTIMSIENNIEITRPRYPFMRSILFKLEESLLLKKNSLVELLIKESKINRKNKKNFILRNYDFINTWVGSILYFLFLLILLFSLKRYFYSSVNFIEMQNFEENIGE